MSVGTAISKSTLTSMVTEQLRRDILLGVLEPGSRVTVQSITERYSTSALPVREAIQILTSEGLLENQPYKGATVCAVDKQFISNIYDVLRSMETLIIESIEGHWNEEIRSQVVKINSEIKKISTPEDVAQKFNQLNRGFHDPLEQFCMNDCAIDLRQKYHKYITILVEGGRPHSVERVRQIAKEHDAIINALDSGDMHQVRKAYNLHSAAAKKEFFWQLSDQADESACNETT